MAMTVYVPTDFMNQLNKLGNDIDAIAPQMVEAGANILVSDIKQRLEAHKRTGTLAKSIKLQKARNFGGEFSSGAYADGYRKTSYKRDGESRKTPNALVLMALEYGKSNQAARPIIRPSIRQNEKKVIEEMQAVFNRNVNI